jgi:DNA repair exonuclease SbcCD nuclease subunit
MHLIIGGDSHFGLKTEGIDRTDDILDSKIQILKYMLQLKKEGEDVIYLDMGDVFHGTRPTTEVMATAISYYRTIDSEGIDTLIIAGNHDVIDQKGKTSALAPLQAVGFKHLHIYHDITLVSFHPSLNIVTLPHISKAHAVEEGFKTVQEYIDTKAKGIEEILPENQINIVIGHMNVEGAKTGTESYMIKGAHEDFPQVLKKSKKVNYIFNGHIHRPQVIENPNGPPIIITGDISTNDFGERLDTKVFFDLELS